MSFETEYDKIKIYYNASSQQVRSNRHSSGLSDMKQWSAEDKGI